MNHWLRNFILLALMLATSAAAVALKPTQKIVDQGPKLDLEIMIPRTFSDWREQKSHSAQIVDPQQQASLDRIYNQILTRTYVNSHGQSIMLSIAYGSNQSDELQVHRPEVCYATQGFEILGQRGDKLTLPEGNIPVKRVLAVQGRRIEPITYWITVGDQVTYSSIGQKIAQLKYSITGIVPDGMLVRVSTIEDKEAQAYAIENQFINDMIAAMAPADRTRLIGQPSS